jgi:PIN domain nuclease of toxin-antitoxin system
MLNLDTHILLFALTDSLKKRERELLQTYEWSISAIVLWELAKLKQLGRIEIDFEDSVVTNVFRLIHVWPIDFEIATTSCKLDFESDPADELIAATSVIRNIPLLTRDRTLSRSKLVPLA